MRRHALAFALLAACGGADTPPPVELGAFAQTSAETICAGVFRCCSDSERNVADRFGFDATGSESNCVTSLYVRLATTQEQMVERVASGLFTYDAAATGACLDEMASSCAWVDGSVEMPSCGPLITGAVLEGQTCAYQDECGEGLTCGAEATCVPRFAEGEGCSGGFDSLDCADGLYCAGDPRAGTCEAKADLGETCYFDETCLSGFCAGTCAEPPKYCQGAAE